MFQKIKAIFAISLIIMVGLTSFNADTYVTASAQNDEIKNTIVESIEIDSQNNDGGVTLKIKQKNNNKRAVKMMKLSKSQVEAFEEGAKLLEKKGEIKPSNKFAWIRSAFGWVRDLLVKGQKAFMDACFSGNSWLARAFGAANCGQAFTWATCAFFGQLC